VERSRRLTFFIYHAQNADMHPVVGRYVKELRQKRDWSQEQLADKAKISTNTLRKIERGMKRPPRTETLDRIAKAFHMTLEQLFQGPRGLQATDPKLVGMNEEDLDVARRYHDAPTKLRHEVLLLLAEGLHGDRLRVLTRFQTLGPELREAWLTAADELPDGPPSTATPARPRKSTIRKTS